MVQWIAKRKEPRGSEGNRQTHTFARWARREKRRERASVRDMCSVYVRSSGRMMRQRIEQCTRIRFEQTNRSEMCTIRFLCYKNESGWRMWALLFYVCRCRRCRCRRALAFDIISWARRIWHTHTRLFGVVPKRNILSLRSQCAQRPRMCSGEAIVNFFLRFENSS